MQQAIAVDILDTNTHLQNAGKSGSEVDVDNLYVARSHDSVDILSGISVNLKPGQILGIVGESGSGKSSLGLAMLGYLQRGLKWSRGSISVGSVNIINASEGERNKIRGRSIAYIPQDPATALNPALSIERQLGEMVRQHGVADGMPSSPRCASIAACRAAGLADPEALLSRYPHQLSGGQNQRVGIAMALVCGPSIIILDEPTTGLDVTTQRHLLSTIRDLVAKTNVAMAYISHDMAVISELADNVAVMYSGRLVETGSLPAAFKHPHHPYTRALIRAVPTLGRDNRLHGIDGTPPEPGKRSCGCIFAPRCAFATDECRAQEPALRPAKTHSGAVRCIFDEFSNEGPAVSTNCSDAISISVRSPSSPVLSVENLITRYQGKAVLHGVSLELKEGECLGIVGESGSGKTTLSRSIAGLVSDWSGTIRLGGEELNHVARARPDEHLRIMQYIFQNPYGSLNPSHSIRQSLELPLRRFGYSDRSERGDRIERVLNDVSLPISHAEKRPSQLSGGERQRVAIARALVVEPQVLICDEITSALDVSIQASIIELLKVLQRERQTSIIFITHNLALISNLAQRIVIMSQGNIVEKGNTLEIFDKPNSEYTRQLLDNIPNLRI